MNVTIFINMLGQSVLARCVNCHVFPVGTFVSPLGFELSINTSYQMCLRFGLSLLPFTILNITHNFRRQRRWWIGSHLNLSNISTDQSRICQECRSPWVLSLLLTRLTKRIWGLDIHYFRLQFWTSYIISTDKEDGESVAILIFQIFQEINQGFIKSAGPHSNFSRAVFVAS